MQMSDDKTSDEGGARYEQVLTNLRKRIIGGDYAPGERLPTFDAIQQQFDISRSVAQLAVTRLKQDGFVDTRNRRGLFVAENPPHLSRYGVVFPFTRSDPNWSRFNSTFTHELKSLLEMEPGREALVFAGSADSGEGKRIASVLQDEIRNDCLAGLILTPGTFELAETAWLRASGAPLVFVFSYPTATHRPVVTTDGQSLTDRALHWLGSRGRRRIAVIKLVETADISAEEFARQGLEFRPQWQQSVGRGHPEVVANLIRLLFDYPADQCPDGLLIADDNLVEYAAGSVLELGKRIGHDLDIVAHCNWPSPAPSMAPMRRIGYQIGDMASLCVNAINAQRQGEPVPDEQAIPALFEDEVAARSVP